jgi:hypothetical protein
VDWRLLTADLTVMAGTVRVRGPGYPAVTQAVFDTHSEAGIRQLIEFYRRKWGVPDPATGVSVLPGSDAQATRIRALEAEVADLKDRLAKARKWDEPAKSRRAPILKGQ